MIFSPKVGGKTEKENVDSLLFVYAYRGIAKHHCTIYGVKAHAINVSVLTFYSWCLLNLANFDKQEYKANASISICL